MREAHLDHLCKLIRATRGDDELSVLLTALLTPQELQEIDTRWQLLCRLDAGETQRGIAHELGISLGKIARGSRLLKHDLPEFRDVMQHVQEHLADDAADS